MKTTEHKQFKPYDRVLVRACRDKWQIDFYSHWKEELKQHITFCFKEDGWALSDDDILPYEGNEHLLGTTDEPEEEVRLEEGEWVFASTKSYRIDEDWCFGRFKGISTSDNKIILKGLSWSYAIRFSDFNPNDMEETKKHILCVKNGKIVRYKE